MLETLGTSVVNVSAQWWDAPEYNEGELYLPSARSLSPEHQKILESIAAAAENKEIEIPPMPQAALEAMKLMRTADPEMDDIVECIQMDAAMTAQLLRHANSALYGARVHIDSLGRAASYLGIRRLKSVILKVALLRLTDDLTSKSYAQMEWHYSTHCAAISRQIAKRFNFDEELCYLSGLLHDIGRLVVLQALERRDALDKKPAEDSPADIIMEALHRAIGRQVAEAWELPMAVQDAVAYHLTGRLADEDSPSQFPSTQVAEASGDLCLALGVGRFRKTYDLFDAHSLKQVGFDRDGLIDFLGNVLPDTLSQVTTFSS